MLAYLRHLDETRQIEDLEGNDCLFVIEMIEKHMVSDQSVEFTAELEAALTIILKQASPTSPKLSGYMLANMDPKTLAYLDICCLRNEIPSESSDLTKLALAV